jgi:hypothetical protein
MRDNRYLLRRTRDVMRSWPAATRTIAADYFRSAHPGAAVTERDDRYWLLLPRWLLHRQGNRDPDLLHDILWGQYCLFASVRIQDDVLDRQASSARLLFVATEFQIEAERAFARLVEDEPFWSYFREARIQTARGILRADALQRGPAAPVQPLLRAYARVSALLKVGAAAVCLPRGDDDDFARVERFADHVAIAGQLVDDLEDIEDDLADGRVNAAARMMVPSAAPGDPHVRRKVVDMLLGGDGVERILKFVGGHYEKASATLAPLAIPEAVPHFRQAQRNLSNLAAGLHRARVDAVFRPLLRAADHDRSVRL